MVLVFTRLLLVTDFRQSLLLVIDISSHLSLLKLRFMVVSANGLTTVLQRYYNGLTTMTLMGFRFHGCKGNNIFGENVRKMQKLRYFLKKNIHSRLNNLTIKNLFSESIYRR